nr:sensor domain-containing diguanylate cyclase [Rhabdothermincola salaria]
MDPCVLLVAERRDGQVVDFRCVEANRAAAEDQGLGPGDLVGSRLGDHFPGADLSTLIESWTDVVDGGPALVLDDLVSPPGVLHQSRRYDVRSAKAGDGVVVTWRDVTERSMASEALDRRARTDELTGLANRAEVIDHLSTRLAATDRSGELAALFCDIDHFKDINDTWGHATGDEVLRSIARQAPSVIRSGDVFGRMGGDEFLAVLDGVADLDHAVQIAERLRRRIREPLELSTGTLLVGLSVGVVLARPGETLDDLLARSDHAMYRAKRAGRNRVFPID